jgi:hypothetical protein
MLQLIIECKMVYLLWMAWQSLEECHGTKNSTEGTEIGLQADICTLTFIAELFTVAKKVEATTRPSTGEWLNKMWYIHTKEY